MKDGVHMHQDSRQLILGRLRVFLTNREENSWTYQVERDSTSPRLMKMSFISHQYSVHTAFDTTITETLCEKDNYHITALILNDTSGSLMSE